ncbi:2435_t:CDS:2 [Funneliformis caledonium]|uniref:2435_t:CDS:1 n=1 Tax=Funneliformis caledonium TaxID=1117310 RepID=A0A9N8YQQ5_9GLOM|nr:2435_t:CDS:2 [Funneliformis caledonium]
MRLCSIGKKRIYVDSGMLRMGLREDDKESLCYCTCSTSKGWKSSPSTIKCRQDL